MTPEAIKRLKIRARHLEMYVVSVDMDGTIRYDARICIYTKYLFSEAARLACEKRP